MIVKIKRVDGAIECFETGNFVISTVKDMHSDILDAEILTNDGTRIARRRRLFQRFYKKFLYKPEPMPPQPDEHPEEAPAEALKA